MKLRRTNIPGRIARYRNRRITEEVLLQQVYAIFREDKLKEENILSRLTTSEPAPPSNIFNFELLESNRIFHIMDIEKICIDYRLRFLDSALYKIEFPAEGIMKIKNFEKEHQTCISGFKLMAPASVFKLKNADDPLLFAPLGNDYYYLLHSWGRDLHPLRKLMMWPFRQLENFMFFLLILSLLFTSLIPSGMFSMDYSTTEFFILFFFMFKWVTGLAIFYGFKYGKNFSAAVWRSTFSNA